MELHPLVQIEWRQDLCLSPRSLIWIREHADPEDDPNPVITAIAELRAERVDRLPRAEW